MAGIFRFTLEAVGPIVGLILIGYLLRRRQVTNAVFLKTGNKLVFHVFLPVLLFYNVYGIKNLSEVRWSAILYALVVVLLLFLLGLWLVHRFIPEASQKGVILQCVFRSNYAIIGLPLAASLGDSSAVAFASVLSAFSIPLYNVLAVIALSLYVKEDKKKVDWRKMLLNIITNPLIVAIAAGLLTLVVRSWIPRKEDGELFFPIQNTLPAIYKIIQDLARLASPLALIVMGGLFEFKAIGRLYRQILLGTVMRIAIAPAIGLGLGIFLSEHLSWITLTTAEYPALVALFSTPVAVSSAIMAGEMKNDEQLAGQLVVWTSLISVVSICIVIMVMKYYEFL